MKLNELKSSIIDKINNTDQISILQSIYDILFTEKVESHTEITSGSTDLIRDEVYNLTSFEKILVEKSRDDFKTDSFFSNDDFFKNIKEWLKEQ
jgi:hypothetical protein